MRMRLQAARGSFWLPAAIAVSAGVVVGLAFTSVQALTSLHLGLFGLSDQESARAVLQTIATATVSVAGLSFSVTLVALTLAAQQLSPRVLRTFRADRVAQLTLAAFLGTFAYALVVLARLTAVSGPRVPEFAVTIAILLAIASFAMFVAFIGDIVVALQASTVIRRIALDAEQGIAGRNPRGVGRAADASAEVPPHAREGTGAAIRAGHHGYLTHVDQRLVGLAATHGCFIAQRVPVGEYVVTGQVVAEAWPLDGRAELDELAQCFALAPERTMTADPGFAVRQLADIALRALSPGVNDPTTAENAMSALTDVVIRFAADDPVVELRVDEDGIPRFAGIAVTVDELKQVGFEQVRKAAAGEPVIERRLAVLLGEIDDRR